MSAAEPMSDAWLAELHNEYGNTCGACGAPVPCKHAPRNWQPEKDVPELVAEVRRGRSVDVAWRAALKANENEEAMADERDDARARVDELEQTVQRVREWADTLDSWHDGSLVTSDYPMIARRIRLALDGGAA